MSTSNVHQATAKRDAAHRRVRTATYGMAALAIGATSYGGVALALTPAESDTPTTVIRHSPTSDHVSPGNDREPVTSSGGS